MREREDEEEERGREGEEGREERKKVSYFCFLMIVGLKTDLDTSRKVLRTSILHRKETDINDRRNDLS